jgi:hypothetical protein
MPESLEHHDPAREALVEFITQLQRGSPVALPVDLSQIVRDASVPWPAPAPKVAEREALEATARDLKVEIRLVEHDQPEGGVVTVHLNVGGTPTVVVVDPRGGRQEALRFRFVEGAHPWQVTPAEQRAMGLALVRAATTRPT